MRTKPLLARLIALGLFLVPLDLFFRLELVRRQYGLSYTFDNLKPIIIFSILAFAVGYGVWRVRLWGFFSLFVYGLVSAGFDISYILQGRMKFTYWTALDFTAAFLGMGLILQKKIRAPYFSPKIRWWEQATRYRVDINGKFFVGQNVIDALILDISTSGCFANVDLDVPENSVIRIEISFKDITYTTDAQFIRRSEKPKGIGLKFLNSTKANQKAIRALLSKLVTEQDILR